MTVATEFQATDGGLALSHAILLYRAQGAASRQGADAFATYHEVEQATGTPIIAAGTPLTRAQLRRWTEALGRTAAPEILPANVLVAHADVLAWWVPEQVRPAHFALSEPPAGLKVLAERTTVRVPYPAHLLIATRRGLGVYALPANVRPTAETTVLHSPVLNVFLDGRLCWGSIAKPKGFGIAVMAEFERAVFDSWSTHPNLGQDQTITGKGGLMRLWDDLAARGATRFPVRRLKPFNSDMNRSAKAAPITVGALIARVAR
ncbi:PRTRC system protein B [Novosphingobium sp.]|uniref:PRTRC system protein B n=1 Tax=Novosphingobium sp. TaxID=1874826 RepID=UPI0038BC704F